MFDKNAISRENLYYANLKRDKRIKDQLDEMEREKKAMDKLKYQIEQDKLYQIEKKNRIKQNQYEDYNNYLQQKYSTPPQFREKLNIKLGGEERNIKKTTYNEEMDNLCLNPTRQKNIYPTKPIINYSEMGRNYQKGYSHGYNIITGEVYSNQYNNNQIDNQNKNLNQNENDVGNEKYNLNNKNVCNQNNNYNNLNISPEEYEEFLQYKEMKKQKELQQIEQEKERYNNYINNYKNPQYENAPKKEREEYQLNYNNKPSQNEIPPQYQEEKLYKNDIKEQNDMKYYQQNIQLQNNYNNIGNNTNNIKDNFHYDRDNLNPIMQNKSNDRKKIENTYNENLYKQNQFYEDFEKNYIQNQQKEKEDNKNYNKMPNYNPNYYQQREELTNQHQQYDYKNGIRMEEQIYPQENYNYKNQNYENIPLEYQRRENKINDNKLPPVEYQRNIEINNQQNIPYHYQQREKNENDNEEIQFRNNISLQGNQPMKEYQNPKEQYPSGEEKNNYDKFENEKNIKDIERERYRNFLMSKVNETKEENRRNDIEMNNNLNNININYRNENEQNQKNYLPREEENANNYYRNQENKYYNNYQKGPNEYNNYLPENENYNYNQYGRDRQREFEERNYQEEQEPKYLSYQEQIERIKKQEQNENTSTNNQIIENKNNAKEIISQFNENKRKNTNSEDYIFNVKPVPPTPPKYTDEPLTSKERKEIQKEYAKYLDWQINEKNIRNAKTPMFKKYNPILDDDNSNMKKIEDQNSAVRENNNIIKREIPINPYYNYKNTNL